MSEKGTFWHVYPMKTQFCLHFHAVLSVFLVNMMKLHPWLSKIGPVKILIRLRKCPDWSDFSLGICTKVCFLILRLNLLFLFITLLNEEIKPF